MLDIKFVRENPNKVKENIKNKFQNTQQRNYKKTNLKSSTI